MLMTLIDDYLLGMTLHLNKRSFRSHRRPILRIRRLPWLRLLFYTYVLMPKNGRLRWCLSFEVQNLEALEPSPSNPSVCTLKHD
jgi:hypothetical protein